MAVCWGAFAATWTQPNSLSEASPPRALDNTQNVSFLTNFPYYWLLSPQKLSQVTSVLEWNITTSFMTRHIDPVASPLATWLGTLIQSQVPHSKQSVKSAVLLKHREALGKTTGLFHEAWQYHCCRFSRNIAQVTPKNNYFYYQKHYLQDQSIQKNNKFNFEISFTG